MASRQWVRVDVAYFRNPKILRVGTEGALLHLAAILYLGEHRRDTGLLPSEAVALIIRDVGVRRADVVVASLVRHGLWHEEPVGGGYVVHDYGETNGAESEAALDRERKRRERYRSRRRRDEDDDEA